MLRGLVKGRSDDGGGGGRGGEDSSYASRSSSSRNGRSRSRSRSRSRDRKEAKKPARGFSDAPPKPEEGEAEPAKADEPAGGDEKKDA